MSARSFLFVPADQPEKLAKSRGRGADAVIVDLEDAVAPAARPAALGAVARWMAAVEPAGSDLWVRVSSAAEGRAQLAELPREHLAGLVVPKVGGVAELDELAAADVPLIVFVETAAAVLAAAEIAAIPTVVRLVIGEADLGAELGIDPRGASPAWWPIRAQVVVASAAAAIDAPLGPVHPDFRDLDAYRASTEQLLAAGFGGRCCIHPAQVAVVNEVYTPAPHEIAAARELLDAYEAATDAGSGVLVGADGSMVDEAYVRTARNLLDRARRAGALD
jgi:citrate lyase subunit beta/citryl-CoA lyase